MSKSAKVRVLRNFHRLTNDQMVSAGTAAGNGLDGNPKVPNPPVTVADFKTQLQTFGGSVAAAQDGGKKAITERNKQRKAFEKTMNKEALYVEEIAGTDATVITSAGFQVFTGPTPPAPLAQPVIQKVVQKASGQQAVSPSSVAGARMLEIHFGVPGPGGTPPTNWTTVQTATARPATLITGLTPGTTYVYQVRAYGKLGWTEWSDPVIKMST